MTEDLAKIRDRVKKLLALGNNSAATEHEAAQALQMASDLMARYNIQIDASPNVEDRQVMRGQWYTYEHPWQKIAAMAAGALYNCQVISSTTEYQFVGRSHNIDAARDTHLWIMQQIESFYKQALTPGLSKSDRAEFRRTFKFACANRVYFRSQDIKSERQRGTDNNKAIEQTGSNALVVVKSIVQQIEEVRAFMDEIPGLRTGRSVRYKLGSGTAAGNRAGNNVQLNRALK